MRFYAKPRLFRSMGGEDMKTKHAFIAAHASEHAIRFMCRVLGVAHSWFHARRRAAPKRAERVARRGRLGSEIREIFEQSKRCYGAPRIHAELKARQVFNCVGVTPSSAATLLCVAPGSDSRATDCSLYSGENRRLVCFVISSLQVGIQFTAWSAIREQRHSLGWWLREIAQTFEGRETTFLSLCDLVLRLEYDGEQDAEDIVGRAINHPIGRVTDALLRWWYRNPLEDEQGLPEELNRIFTELCDARVGAYRHGRVLLASRVITLFRVDCEWTSQHLLPLFEWKVSELEARSAWEGFLWAPQLYGPLMEVLKPAFLETANQYAARSGVALLGLAFAAGVPATGEP